MKTKKIRVFCSECKKNVELKVSKTLAQNRDYYPFEYINVHGDPEHALMIFLDAHLTVRDVMVYLDVALAKRKQREISQLVRMSEEEALLSIYQDPLRLKIFQLLTEGPMSEYELIEELEKEPNFEEKNFNTLILPLIKSELLITKWINETFFECYFLIKDFMAIRIPFEIPEDKFSQQLVNKSKTLYDHYLNARNEFFKDFGQRMLNNNDERIEETKFCLEILSELKIVKALRALREGPKSLKALLELTDKKVIKKLVDQNIVFEAKNKDKTFYFLMADLKVIKFTPKYLVSTISEKYQKRNITFEMANTHLDLLYTNS